MLGLFGHHFTSNKTLKIVWLSLLKSTYPIALGYYGEDDILDDQEQAALVPMEGEKVMCVQCNKVLGSMYSAKRHYVSRHQQNQKARCQICQKVYKNINSRNAHMKIEHGVSASMMKKAVSMPQQHQTSYE